MGKRLKVEWLHSMVISRVIGAKAMERYVFSIRVYGDLWGGVLPQPPTAPRPYRGELLNDYLIFG